MRPAGSSLSRMRQGRQSTPNKFNLVLPRDSIVAVRALARFENSFVATSTGWCLAQHSAFPPVITDTAVVRHEEGSNR